MTALGTPATHCLAMRFEVVVSGFNLMFWTSCTGLEVAFQHEPVKELGQHAYTTFIPGRAEYPKVVLQRAIQTGDWTVTKAWLETVTGDGLVSARSEQTATITLHDASRQPVASWTLRNAMPAAWKGPRLDSNGRTFALETLELVHEGFLDD
jgi:phage tail-like protein